MLTFTFVLLGSLHLQSGLPLSLTHTDTHIVFILKAEHQKVQVVAFLKDTVHDIIKNGRTLLWLNCSLDFLIMFAKTETTSRLSAKKLLFPAFFLVNLAAWPDWKVSRTVDPGEVNTHFKLWARCEVRTLMFAYLCWKLFVNLCADEICACGGKL